MGVADPKNCKQVPVEKVLESVIWLLTVLYLGIGIFMALILLVDARRVLEWRHFGHVSKEPRKQHSVPELS